MTRYALAAAAAFAAFSAQASAASLVYVEITGPTGTVWDTEVDGNYAVFLQQPFGTVLNPNDNFAPNATEAGENNFLIAGDGFPSGTSANSDPFYNLLLRFADGATITGQYSFAIPGGQFIGGTSATVGDMTYTLNGFGWDRSRANNVSRFTATPGDDPSDYTGQFSFSAVSAAVPEPATWALFIIGFGAIGGALRRRNAVVRASKATLHFA